MTARGVSKLKQLKKDELINEVRNKQFEIQKLKKEIERQKVRWQNYYRDVDWRKRTNYNKKLRERYSEDKEYRNRKKEASKRSKGKLKLKKQEVKNGIR